MQPTSRGSKTRWLINIILSLGVMALGLVIWQFPHVFDFPPSQSWIGLVLAVYGFLRALFSYQNWKNAK